MTGPRTTRHDASETDNGIGGRLRQALKAASATVKRTMSDQSHPHHQHQHQHQPHDDEPTTTPEGGDADFGPLPALAPAEIYTLMANERRRYILAELAAADGPVTRRALARGVAARELNCPPAEVSDYDRHRVDIGIYSNHLPKLTEYGLITETDDGIAASIDVDRLWALHREITLHAPKASDEDVRAVELEKTEGDD